MLELRGVSHRYGKTPSVADIDLTVNDGEVVSLLGPSGCGKSTILRLIAGLERPLSGEVRLNGDIIATPDAMLPPEERGIGLVFQDYALFPHMSVFENINYGLKHRFSGDNSARVREVLAHVDLEWAARSMPHELSGGQQQRVALARALAPKPSLILLDEPFAGLDSRLRERIRDDTLHILKALKTTVLLVTHDSEEAMFMSDRIMVMRSGSIAQVGRPIDLYCRPATAFVAEFFGEVNRIDGIISGGALPTPFGFFPMQGAADGVRGSMIIRFEGLTLATDEAPNATVMDVRLLGRYSLIHLSVPQEGGADLHLHARVPGLNMLQSGSPVTISLSDDQYFLFEGGANASIV